MNSKVYYICPTNLDYMPYFKQYSKGFSSKNKVIIWDRFRLIDSEEDGMIVYKENRKKLKHRRGLIDYLSFSIFVTLYLLRNASSHDKLVVYGPQLLFFLWPIILLKKCQYIVDYRDYHILTRFTPMFVYGNARLVVVSSPGFYKYLPKDCSIVLNHNYIEEDYSVKSMSFDHPINISNIGAIRDFSINNEFILKFANNKKFQLNYHGQGDALPALKKIVKSLNISNVKFTDKYLYNEEQSFYEESNFINLLREAKKFNDTVALPNRLYNCAKFARPIICLKGTVLSEYVKHYSLGICSDSIDLIEDDINEYVSRFSFNEFLDNCNKFLLFISSEQTKFYTILSGVLNE